MKTLPGSDVDRFMLHLQNKGFGPTDSSTLLLKARNLCSDMKIIIRDCRVSSKFIEFDISVDKSKIEELSSTLSPIGPLDNVRHVVEEKIEKEDAIKEGIFYFNNERFWECHEVLEGVWKNCYEGEKDLVQGMILVAAALVHFQKAEENICMSILGRALEKLSNSNGIYHSIDVDQLRQQVLAIKNSGKISLFRI